MKVWNRSHSTMPKGYLKNMKNEEDKKTKPQPCKRKKFYSLEAVKKWKKIANLITDNNDENFQNLIRTCVKMKEANPSLKKDRRKTSSKRRKRAKVLNQNEMAKIDNLLKGKKSLVVLDSSKHQSSKNSLRMNTLTFLNQQKIFEKEMDTPASKEGSKGSDSCLEKELVSEGSSKNYIIKLNQSTDLKGEVIKMKHKKPRKRSKNEPKPLKFSKLHTYSPVKGRKPLEIDSLGTTPDKDDNLNDYGQDLSLPPSLTHDQISNPPNNPLSHSKQLHTHATFLSTSGSYLRCSPGWAGRVKLKELQKEQKGIETSEVEGIFKTSDDHISKRNVMIKKLLNKEIPRCKKRRYSKIHPKKLLISPSTSSCLETIKDRREYLVKNIHRFMSNKEVCFYCKEISCLCEKRQKITKPIPLRNTSKTLSSIYSPIP
ncbi:unnamed protein product [Moneuplotes crassus]|uniref:Uncharacterized protein n=1 Tax=Euplotes crassus TaxID=5936 RepID=A0AAD1Y5A6_EUPCR|nr:unnamed protein product [Moneuplotes crassus]